MLGSSTGRRVRPVRRGARRRSTDPRQHRGARQGSRRGDVGVGGALAGVGIGLQAIGSKDQAAHQQLQAAVEATGASYDDYERQVEAAIKTQEKFGDSADQTQDALRILTRPPNSPTKALHLLSTATDLAAAKHESLSDAATSLGKVYNGNTRLLKEFGIHRRNTGRRHKGARDHHQAPRRPTTPSPTPNARWPTSRRSTPAKSN